MRQTQVLDKVKVSRMSGKLKGIESINTNPLTNMFCKRMCKNKNIICGQCYAIYMLKTFRQYCAPAFEYNSKLLSAKLLKPQQLPTFNSLYVRIHSYGELINRTHYENIKLIAKYNHSVRFVLWSKRKDIIRSKKSRPNNLWVIYSEPKLNQIKLVIPPGFDKVFANYTKEFIDKNKRIKMNCTGECMNCLHCYNRSTKLIRELVKKDKAKIKRG